MKSMSSTSLYAAIDLGSNSFHMLVVREVAGSIQTLSRIKRKVRLAAGLNSDNTLSAEAEDGTGLAVLTPVCRAPAGYSADANPRRGHRQLRLAVNAGSFWRKRRRSSALQCK